MPLSHLGELLEYALQEEQRQAKREQEKQLFPLWLVAYGVSRLKNTPIMSFEEFLNSSRQSAANDAVKKPISKRTAEEILSDFAPLIEADRKRGE